MTISTTNIIGTMPITAPTGQIFRLNMNWDVDDSVTAEHKQIIQHFCDQCEKINVDFNQVVFEWVRGTSHTIWLYFTLIDEYHNDWLTLLTNLPISSTLIVDNMYITSSSVADIYCFNIKLIHP